MLGSFLYFLMNPTKLKDCTVDVGEQLNSNWGNNSCLRHVDWLEIIFFGFIEVDLMYIIM